MSTVASAGGASAATAAAVIQNAIKANGAIIYVEPDEFIKILSRTQNPIVITTRHGVFSKKHKYLTSYKGFVFYSRSSDELSFSMPVELISAGRIWVPDM